MTYSKSVRYLGIAAALVWSLAGASPTVASSDECPEGASILEAFVEATGGKANYAKIENRVMRGVLDLAAQGVKLQMTVYTARPNKGYMLIESDAIGQIEKGTDGDVVWEVSAMMGPQLKEGTERTDFLREIKFNKFTDWRETYEQAECVALETIDDRPTYKVELTPRDGSVQTLYFDKESKLLVRHNVVVENPMGTLPVKTFISDYREVDGVLIPFTSKILIMEQERIMTTESIEHNVDLPADRFDLPEEIQALVKSSADGGKG